MASRPTDILEKIMIISLTSRQIFILPMSKNDWMRYSPEGKAELAKYIANRRALARERRKRKGTIVHFLMSSVHYCKPIDC